MEVNSFNLSATELPYSLEAEQSVIGAVIADPAVMPSVIEKIKPDYFYNENLRKIYNVISRMFASDTPIDIVTVLNESEKLHIFENQTEGRRFFLEIANMLPSTRNVDSYCKIISDKFFIRSLGNAAKDILYEIQNGEQNAQLLLDSAEQKIYNIRQGKNVSGLSSLADAVLEAYDRLGKITGEDREKYIGAKTGFTMLDSITSGLNKSDLIIIAARPGMGKTSFAMNIAKNVAKSTDKDVVIFNLEMSKEQLATRMLSTESRIESGCLRNGRIHTDDWTKLATSAAYLSVLPIYIDDTASMTVQQMKAKLRRVKNLGLIVIDYLQLMTSSSNSDNRASVVSEITRQLKIMAKELDVPVILLSQLNRAVESRNDKRPMMSDLRESGAIEQDADIILFLYRDAYYNKDSQQQNISECIVAKNRHGETGTVNLIWNGQFTLFSNPEYDTPPGA
ncbi:MAG: replicative DNA helicase [Ruminococcus flavefaciens]|nr:replicative DNA helicase [Ruminococcus flavefaciens]MCM1229218.1 replicative DNA helicase [Ruminococcus flavefaciens]